jgi:uncharacterized protein YlxW (UPF0749 family)
MDQLDATDGSGTPGGPASERATRRAGGTHVARRRLGGWKGGVVVVSALAGGLFALSATTSQGRPLRSDRVDQASFVEAANQRNDELDARVKALREQNEATTTAFGAVDSRVAALQQQSALLAPLTGLDAVRGPVVEVILDDAPRGGPVPPQISPDDLVVHQQDVQAVVNALWTGGAEAMMLMDQRVISTSAVRCVGNTLILKGRVYSPPYRIRAIGDVGDLREALVRSPEIGVYRQFVTLVGLVYEVDEPGEQTFPGYAGPSALQYARPLDAAEGTTSTPATPSAGPSVSPSVSPSATPSVGPAATRATIGR